MRTIDRYVIRELIPPFVIALLVFTFILIIPFIIDLAEQMIAKGVPWVTLARLVINVLPAQLGLTIPMALLIALLVAFGRLSADREVVVLMACGVSPYRLLRPVAVFAVAAWAATSWILLKAMPDGNQAFREISLGIVMDRAEGEVRPRVFFEDFPGIVLYVREVPLDGGWKDVLAADTSNPSQPVIYLASRGRMDVNRSAKTIQMVLEEGTRHQTKVDDPSAYEVVRFDRTVVTLDPERVFPKQGPPRGDRELTVAELQARAAELVAQGLSPHNQIIEIHTKFAIPVACFVFGILGLALGASHRRDGRLASFVIGIAIIFVYYVIMFTARSMTKGHLIPAWSAMWWPNLILGGAGVWLLFSRARFADRPLPLPPLASWWSRVMRSSSATGAEPPHAETRLLPTATSAAGVKLPSVTALRPNLLDIYVAKRYLQVLAMTTVGMLGLFYISTFIDLSDKWFKGQTTLATLLEFLWWSTPQFLSYVIALAVLLSALVTIGLLTKNSELIVMRACGISLYRTAVPLVLFGMLASAMLWQMEESVLATANQRAGRLNHVIRGGSPQTFDVLNRKWVLGHNGEVYHYQFYDPRRHELNGLSVFEFDPRAHAIARRLFATKAVWEPAPGNGIPQWRLEQGWSREFGSTKVTAFDRFEHREVALEPPDYFVTEAPEPERMTFGQLRGYIDELRASGYNVLDHEVGLYRKVAFPFVTLVMTLIAVPFAVTTGRRGAMYGVGIGIVLALVYWTLISVFAAFGAGGLMTPLLAAWAPNLLFGATAAALVLTVRT